MPKPYMNIELVPGSNSEVMWNHNGASASYDFAGLVQENETDTNLSVDASERNLLYRSEKHEDIVTHKDLGSVLHVGDLGDVNLKDLSNNSLFVYQKNSNCAQGCDGIDNSWIAWNALDHQVDSLYTVMGYDDDGKPLTLSTPANSNQQYLLGWNAEHQVSYFQVTEASSAPKDSAGYKYAVYVDPETKALVYVKEK